MSFDHFDLVRSIEEQRHSRRTPPSKPLERRRRRHAMAKALHGLADRIDD